MSNNTPFREYDLLLVGDGGVGKTTLLNRLLTGEFEKKYVCTMGLEVHSLTFSTNWGPIKFNVHDTSGIARHLLSPQQRGHHFDGAIIMFDVSSRITYKNVPNRHLELTTRVCDKKLPIVIVGNKIDFKEPYRKVKDNQITFPRKTNTPYGEMSVKLGFNVEWPFLSLAQQLVGDDGLKFVEHYTESLVSLAEIAVIASSLDKDSVKDLMLVAHLHHLLRLKRACFCFVRQNLKTMLFPTDPNFMELWTHHRELWTELVQAINEE